MSEHTHPAQTSPLARASRFLGVLSLLLLLFWGGLILVRVSQSTRAGGSSLQDLMRAGESDPPRAGVIEFFLYEVLLPGTAAATALAAFVLGIMALVAIRQGAGKVLGTGLAVSGLATGTLTTLALALVYGVVVPALERETRKLESANNLKRLGLAMHLYYENYGSFPPRVLRDRGQPYSWRVALLPFLGQDQLFSQYRRDEPWDSTANQAVLARMPRVFALPGGARNGDGLTHYQVLVGPGTAFERPEEGVRLTGFSRGPEQTILVVEAADPVPWTKPEDLAYAPDGPLPKVGGLVGKGFHALFANGDVRWIEAAVQDSALCTLVLLLNFP